MTRAPTRRWATLVPALTAILLALALALAVFGWWGTQTPAGRQAYDEMAGILPETACVAAPLLALAAAALTVWSRRRARRVPPPERD